MYIIAILYLVIIRCTDHFWFAIIEEVQQTITNQVVIKHLFDCMPICH